MKKRTVRIDQLIAIVNNGGTVKTGVDIYSRDGRLLLEKNVLISSTKPLEIIKQNSIDTLSIDPELAGGLWDQDGKNILPTPPADTAARPSVEERVARITRVKTEATQKYREAKESIKKVISTIQKTGGEFELQTVETAVTELFDFITQNDSAFFYLTRDIFSYDDYLYHHAINVCTIGTAIIKKTAALFPEDLSANDHQALFDMSTGLFLHDVGKVLIPQEILNKAGKLTAAEFEVVKGHSYKTGATVLKKNRIKAPLIRDIVLYHHAALFKDEPRCYPRIDHDPPPIHVAVAKLADIYDAMTSKRCYKDAFNPVAVVTGIVRDYAGKDERLQRLLHAFVKSVGIYPPGSVVHLATGRLAFVLDSDGPVVVPFTDAQQVPLREEQPPIDLGAAESKAAGWKVNDEKPLLSPTEAFPLLPPYLKHQPGE